MYRTPDHQNTNNSPYDAGMQAFYRQKAKETILRQLISGFAKTSEKLSSAKLEDMELNFDVYQVVIGERFYLHEKNPNCNFPELLHTVGGDDVFFEYLQMDQRDVVLLKGRQGLHIFRDLLHHYDNIEPGSSMDFLFLAYGSPVTSPDHIHISYEEARSLISQRFFCSRDRHTLGYTELTKGAHRQKYVLDSELSEKYCSLITNCLQASDIRQIDSTLLSLKAALRYADCPIHSIKFFLAGLLLQVKENTLGTIPSLQYPSNTDILMYIDNCHYLDEILLYLHEQFKKAVTGNSDKATVFSSILEYIDHSYQRSLHLEELASLFGYNSAYLGRLFTKMTGSSFNSYLDHIRIEHSKVLLLENRLRIHEIASKVGYKNTDYFQKKFKKYEGVSPSEYRRKHRLTNR